MARLIKKKKLWRPPLEFLPVITNLCFLRFRVAETIKFARQSNARNMTLYTFFLKKRSQTKGGLKIEKVGGGESFKGDKPFSVVFPRRGPIIVPDPILLPRHNPDNSRPAFCKLKL